MSRNYSLFDHLLMQVDQGVRTLFAGAPTPQRVNPASAIKTKALSPQQRQHSASLMRINHAGEVSAQALYQGQALTAQLEHVRDKMQQAATEENDHLAWCQERLDELDSHTSCLNPLWYLGSFVIGATAGLIGDRWSLGFVAETEHQVIKHLNTHLNTLPPHDNKSRAILEQMKEDEAHHATLALESGAANLPTPIKITMRYCSKVMTTLAYWV